MQNANNLLNFVFMTLYQTIYKLCNCSEPSSKIKDFLAVWFSPKKFVQNCSYECKHSTSIFIQIALVLNSYHNIIVNGPGSVHYRNKLYYILYGICSVLGVGFIHVNTGILCIPVLEELGGNLREQRI